MPEDLLMLEQQTGREVSDDSLAAYTAQELRQSQNWAGSEYRDQIRQSLNYLLMREKGDEVPGRSEIQSGDVADMIDHVHADIQPMYSVDELVEVGEESEEDSEAAAQETQALNWYWRERLRGFEALDEAVQDALLSRNGYIKVWYEETFGLPYEQEVVGTELEVDATIAELMEKSRVELMGEELAQEAVVMTVEGVDVDGVTPFAVDLEMQPAVYRVWLFVTPVIKEVKGASVAPEDMFISKDAGSSNMQRPRFVGERRRMTRQAVKSLGLDPDQADRIPSISHTDADIRNARRPDYNTTSRWAPHQSGQLCDLYECYYLIDRDGDGIPELWKFFYSGNKEVMRYAPSAEYPEGRSTAEMVRVRPYASGSPLRVAHRHQGRSLYDKLKDVEDATRTMWRQLVDNLIEGNDVSLAYGPGANEDDLQETETGKRIACDNPGTDIREIQFNNIAGDSLAGIGAMNRLRRERGGPSIDQSPENMPINQAAHSTERVMSAMERLIAMYARNMIHTMVRDTFVLLHEQMRLLPGKLSFKADDAWQEVEPRRWVQRNRISVTPGLAEGEKLRRIQECDRIIINQGQDMESANAVLVNSRTSYAARLERARLAGMSDPEQFWVDPESDEGRLAAEAQARARKEQQEMQMRMFEAQQSAVMRIAEMQEATKRMEAQVEMLEKQRDRVAKMVQHAESTAQKYVEIEAKYGIDVPGEGVEGGEVVAFPAQS